MAITEILLTNLAVLATAFILLWLASLLLKDASIVDMFWGFGFVVVAWSTFIGSENASTKCVVLLALVTLWGVRLSAYLTWRNLGRPEDFRYHAMRQKHGSRFPVVSLFTVFLLQAFIAWIVSLPIQYGVAFGGTPSLAFSAGILLFVVGLLFEAIGDYQLARFKADPAQQGKVMNRGLWRYTRHPNYFGDFLVWWGFYLVAADSHSWWWTVVGPLVMSVFLIWISGVRHLEGSLKRRLNGYDAYVNSTSSFFPLPPKRSPK